MIHGLHSDLDFVDYLADDSLSSTFARLLTKHVPAKALERHQHHKPTRAMNLGTAAHLRALGTGPLLIVWEHDGRTREGKAERAEYAHLIDSGAAVAVTQDECDQIVDMTRALREHDEVRAILDSAQPEVSAFWEEGTTQLRARFDLLDRDAAYDYKSTTDVSRRGFSKAMASFAYHQQAEFYQRGLRALGHPAGDAPMQFICQETEPPYLVQIHTPDDMALEVARVLNDRAIGIYRACIESGEWPGYEQLEAEPVALPGYYYFDVDEALPDEWRAGQDLVIT